MKKLLFRNLVKSSTFLVAITLLFILSLQQGLSIPKQNYLKSLIKDIKGKTYILIFYDPTLKNLVERAEKYYEKILVKTGDEKAKEYYYTRFLSI